MVMKMKLGDKFVPKKREGYECKPLKTGKKDSKKNVVKEQMGKVFI